MSTITVELLREDAWDLLRQLERLAILRIEKPKTVAKKKSTGISKLRGTLNWNVTVEEVESQLKSIRDEWERDFY